MRFLSKLLEGWRFNAVVGLAAVLGVHPAVRGKIDPLQYFINQEAQTEQGERVEETSGEGMDPAYLELLKTIQDPLLQENEYPVSVEFIDAIMSVESSINPRAKSYVGARGLMQIMPDTWADMTKRIYGEELDFELAFNPSLNSTVGREYLDFIDNYLSERIKNWEWKTTFEKQKLIGAAYNGGIGRLVKKKGVIENMPSETRDYVKKLERELSD